MQVTPISENNGNTVRMSGASGLNGLRVSQSRPPTQEPMSDEDEEFAALMNDDKKKRTAFASGLPGGGSVRTENRFELPGDSTPTPQTHFERPATPDFISDSVNANSPQDASFRSIEEEKQHYLYRIQRMQSRIPGRRVSIETPLEELKYEYDRLKRQQELNSSVKLQRRMLMAAVTGIEFMNKQFNPLGLHLDGWSETVMDSLEDYDPTFEQLHERYTGTAEVSPEWNLMMMLLGSGFMYHLSNTLFRSVLPNVNDIAKQNPDLMQNIANAMSNAMGQQPTAMPGHNTTQMGANLAMQAMQSRKQGTSDAASSSALIEEDEDDNDELEERHVTAGLSRAMKHNAKMVLPPNPTALQRPALQSTFDDDNDSLDRSDVSSELSGMSEELRGAKPGKRQKKRDNRKAIDLSF